MTVQQALLERDAELEGIEQALDRAASGEGSLLQIEGAAGIGKTSLLDAGRELADERGLRILAARGGELERDFAYGVVRRLFERELGEMPDAERADVLSGSAAFAGPAVGVETNAEATGPDATFAVVHGLYWLTANLAAREPLLLVVDDLHWADDASLRFLLYLAARVDELPLAILLAARRHEPGAERELVDQLAATPGAELVRPPPFTLGATASYVAAQLDTDVDAAFAEACDTVTGGNPFLLRELVGVLRADGVGAGEHDAARVRELGPDTVSRSLMLRLARMPSAAPPLAAAIAVLGNDVDPRHAAALAGVEAVDAATAVDALVAADILAPAQPLNFVHPIIRSAIYSDIGPGERSTAHERAAHLLSSSGADAERVAPHLLHSTPSGDDRFTEMLREAAQAAMARGAPDAAARYLRRAAQETAAAGADGELLCDLGAAEFLGGDDPQAALSHLRQGIPVIREPGRRAAAWLALARTTMSYVTPVEAVGVLERALDDLSDLDAETRTHLEVELVSLAITHAESFDRAAARVDAFDEPSGDTAAERLVLCELAYRTGQLGTSRERTIELATRALADGRLSEIEGTESSAVNQAAYVLVFADRHEEVRTVVDAALARARASGSAWGSAAAWGVRAS